MIRLPGAIRWLAFCYTTATIFAVLPGPWPPIAGSGGHEPEPPRDRSQLQPCFETVHHDARFFRVKRRVSRAVLVSTTPLSRGVHGRRYFSRHCGMSVREKAPVFPTKWMSDDGKTMHLVFSGEDHFSVRRVDLKLHIP